MKWIPRLFFFVVTVVASFSYAQSEVPDLSDMAAERQRIETARADIERAVAAARAACYRVFFVNSCLDDADEQRRSGLAGLRRQEILLNDQERKGKAATELRKLEEKARPKGRPENFDAGVIPAGREQGVGSTDANPQAAREASPRPPPRSVRPADRAKVTSDKAAARAAKAANEAEQTREFVERQNKAQERRKAYEQSQRDRTKPAARPLPVPP